MPKEILVEYEDGQFTNEDYITLPTLAA